MNEARLQIKVAIIGLSHGSYMIQHNEWPPWYSRLISSKANYHVKKLKNGQLIINLQFLKHVQYYEFMIVIDR